MELKVKRRNRSAKATTGDFYVNGEFFCHTLEDPDRGLRSGMPLEDIKKAKVKGNTCIPTGRYKLTKYNSPKHGGWVPMLIGVPGFDYIQIHAGNTAVDTLGCLLLGTTIAGDSVTESRKQIHRFYPLFFAALDRGEEVWITYE